MRTKITLLFALCLAGSAAAQPTEWWNQAYGSDSMQNKDKASSWVANKGDTLSGLVNSTYKIPLNKMTTMNRVIDAIIAYNNAMTGNREAFNASKVTLITNRDLIFEGKTYFLPDPKSIDRILKGEDPGTVMQESLSDPANRSHANGTPDGMPSHGTGDIDVAGADGDVAPPPGPPGNPGNRGGSTANTADAQQLGDWGARDGRVTVIGVTSDAGPQVPPGSSATTPETPEELKRIGGSEGLWMLGAMTRGYNARAYGVADGARVAGVDAGITR